MKHTTTIAAALLAACGQASDPTPAGAPHTTEAHCPTGLVLVAGECRRAVDFDVECSAVRCRGYDSADEYRGSHLQSATCTWRCAVHEGQIDRYVAITFVRTTDEPCWRIESTYLSEGIGCR
jgi:hypothetical protein